MEKATRILSLVIAVLCLALLFIPEPSRFGLASDRIWSRFTYLWFHGNIIHYLINIYALCTLTFRCGITNRVFALGFIVAVMLPEFVTTTTPIVGLSGWLFFLCGSLAFRMNRQNRVRFILTNIFIIVVTSLLSHIAWGVHLWCFTLGITFAFIDSHKATDKRTA